MYAHAGCAACQEEDCTLPGHCGEAQHGSPKRVAPRCQPSPQPHCACGVQHRHTSASVCVQQQHAWESLCAGRRTHADPACVAASTQPGLTPHRPQADHRVRFRLACLGHVDCWRCGQQQAPGECMSHSGTCSCVQGGWVAARSTASEPHHAPLHARALRSCGSGTICGCTTTIWYTRPSQRCSSSRCQRWVRVAQYTGAQSVAWLGTMCAVSAPGSGCIPGSACSGMNRCGMAAGAACVCV